MPSNECADMVVISTSCRFSGTSEATLLGTALADRKLVPLRMRQRELQRGLERPRGALERLISLGLPTRDVVRTPMSISHFQTVCFVSCDLRKGPTTAK